MKLLSSLLYGFSWPLEMVPTPPIRSTLGMKYPPLRDAPLKTARQWIRGKQKTDGAEGLWRIHNNIYDFSGFISNHPGGREWLELTKGTDITEAFEAHHIKGVAETLLPNYFQKSTATPRNPPFTFHENGFYKTLKKRISQQLPNVPKWPATRSKLYTDALLFSYLILGLLAVYFHSFSLGLLAGLAVSCTAIAAHNFFHQKNNFRMYYFDFILMESQGWRISHALSHHLYPNTIEDLEISLFEPFLWYLPVKKTIFFKIFQLLALPVLSLLMTFGYWLIRVAESILHSEKLRKTIYIPLLFLLPALFVGSSVGNTVIMYLFIQAIGSFHFTMVGVNAAHHHPDLFHEGDTPRPKEELDWGVYQLDAVMDREDITGSHFRVLTNFGDHALHHLFPTIDHGLLEYFYPVFHETCKEFGVRWHFSTQMELVKGQFQQLNSTEPNKEPPRALPVKNETR